MKLTNLARDRALRATIEGRSGRVPSADSAGARGLSEPLFRLDLTMSCLYKAPTSRQAVSNASVGTEHPDRLFSAGTGTNLDECRSNAVDHS